MSDRFGNFYVGEELTRMALGAVRPWKSPDANPTFSMKRLTDSQAQIDKCLSCQKCECSNCLHGRKSKYVSKKLVSFQACAET